MTEASETQAPSAPEASPPQPQAFGALMANLGALPTDDVVHMVGPLFRAVAILHAEGKVAALGPYDIIEADDGSLRLLHASGQQPILNTAEVRRIQPQPASALKVVGEYRVTMDDEAGYQVADLGAVTDDEAEISKPAYLSGYRSWEKEIGHHDEVTDVFSAGLILASLACGLDFNHPPDVDAFSRNRGNLFALNPRLHPVLATLILETTALNRHERATDLLGIGKRLQTYRDQPVGLEVERVLAEAKGAPGRRTAVLSHLRDRLFDLSRRNRLVHFRPTQASVNLTESSVPVVLRLESIRSDQLCVWNEHFAGEVLTGAPVALNKWLRFEEHPYLPSSLDRIIQETRRDRAEYGFSHLRLVAAFLRWNNLKDAPDERIVSPLLWLPVEVVKKKGVRDQYMLQCLDDEAEFNPALRHYLRQLYDIRLPDKVDLAKISMDDIHADLAAQIYRSEPGVRLDLQKRPAIRFIHQKAVQRIRQFERRRGAQSMATYLARPDFSYDAEDYRPLGLALFDKYVRPSPLPQRLAAGGSLRTRPDHMAPTEVTLDDAAATERMTYALAGDDGHKFAWEMDLTQVTLANFNYKKMSLVRDYNQLIETPAEQPAFDRVFSIEPRPLDEEPPAPLPAEEQWNVVAADAAQEAAVALGRTKRSFIIQGPPGTGKSQTITNLIADYAAQGKRVLFVCEKRAALDVVFHRLRQAGLEALSCLIHDSQEDKKAFVMDLKACYERWTRSDSGLDYAREVRDRTLAALDIHLKVIERFEHSMSTLPEGQGALRPLIRRALTLPAPEDPGARFRELLPSPGQWDDHRPLIGRVARTIGDSFGLASLAEHPFARLNAAIVADPQAYGRVEAFLAEAERLLSRLDGALSADDALLTPDLTVAQALDMAQAARRATDTGLVRNLDLLDAHSTVSGDLERARLSLAAKNEERAKAAEGAQHWNTPLTPEDTAAALDQARRQERSVLKIFSGAWHRLSRTVRERYAFSAHAVRPSITLVLERLQALHQAEAARQAELKLMERQFQTPDFDALLDCRDAFIALLPESPRLRALLERAGRAADPGRAISAEANAATLLETVTDLLSRNLDGANELSLASLAEALRDMREGLDDLPDLLGVLAAVHQAGPEMAFALRSLPMAPEALEALVIDEAIARAERADPELRRFDIDRLLSVSRRAVAARDLLRDQNSALIQATQQHKFHTHLKLSNQSVTQLDNEGKRFKKRYANGRRELEHEFGKTMRHRSIRELADGDSGLVVNDLKPIWLMSPLSVSDTLPLESDLFDVVIFDEASQILTEEAVPALSRAPQVVVVGDEMQLPPTSFFSAALDEDEKQVTAEEDGETIAILLDADSLLNQSARNLPATLLAWHYRSRSEALISFSNAAFYEGRLVTIPDKTILQAKDPSAPIPSGLKAAAAGVDQLLASPISTHRVADGLYENRVNPPEARYIAELVREMLKRGIGLSIGIVAFSEAQQTEIETALEVLAADDAVFADLLDRESVREDDGQFNGLFVKNLENVQGDERDIILLSICYAPGRDGRMVMNFGPINQRGGEKRLNVIFSRARQHMAVVATIGADTITNTHNDGARALRTFMAFAEAQGEGAASRAQTILSTLNPQAERTFVRKPSEDPARTSLADALRARGHHVDEDVGSASFRCDLAVRSKDGADYALGILLDRDLGRGTSISDRFLFRPGILRAFGWRVLDLPASRWLRDSENTLARIEAELKRDSWKDQDADPFGADAASTVDRAPRQPLPSAPVSSSEGPNSEASPTADHAMTEFLFQQGGSNKFWKIGANGCDVTVIYGRIGTKGQTMIKAFDTPKRAQAEVTKLILEKTRKGYVEAG